MFVEEKRHGEVTESPSKLDRTSRQILAAAALIEECGHCQNGHGSDVDGRLCVMAALVRVGGFDAEERIESAIPEVSPDKWKQLSKVARWSDGTPTAQVIAKLRAIALMPRG